MGPAMPGTTPVPAQPYPGAPGAPVPAVTPLPSLQDIPHLLYDQTVGFAYNNLGFIALVIALAVVLRLTRQNATRINWTQSFVGGIFVALLFKMLWALGSHGDALVSLGSFFGGIGGIAVAVFTVRLVQATKKLETATEMATYAQTAPLINVLAYVQHDPATEDELAALNLRSAAYAFDDEDRRDREFTAWQTRAATGTTPFYLICALSNVQKGAYATVVNAKMKVTINFPKTSAVDSSIVGDVNDLSRPYKPVP